MKKKINLNENQLDYFNLELNNKQTRILLILVIILVIILLFRKSLNSIIEKTIVFSILFLLFLIISKNLVVTFIGSCIIFLLVNLIINYRNTIENFEDLKVDAKYDVNAEPSFDKNVFEKDDVTKSTDNIQELLKKINGGIELKDDDLKETDVLNIDTTKYSDDKKPNHLKQAQKETYELMNTVNALKDTITMLAPVLQEGKQLMGIFENLKL